MMNIPSGNVTFLFTDIEGSTKLAQKDNEAYLAALRKHNEILNAAIDSNRGFVFKIIGDSFCCAFENPDCAVNAAVDIQTNLNSTDWKEMQIKVRMGIHTGEAKYIKNDYSGYVTLSRTQRIMSAAHGGQVLITHEIYNSVKDVKDSKISFRDFGIRKLKDIVIPEHVYQIVAESIPSEFSPMKSMDARLNNLPVQLTSFIGRGKELDELKKLLSEIRLLSIVGFGGTGKTRLAIRVASYEIDEFANGVWFVELAHLSEPSNILQEIAIVLNIATGQKRKILDVLTDFLREKDLLLILDNCEHLITECAIIAEHFLQHCSKIKIMVTSREPLHISGEGIYHVPTLSLPDTKNPTVESISQYESVSLFIDRALAVNVEFQITNENAPAVAELCYQLDGIPLAIELAAARVKLLSVENILKRLSDRFNLLKGSQRASLPRQQTLKALIDWSYELLSEKEKLLFNRLSIFSGGWTLEAAGKVCSDEIIEEDEILDLLSHLEDKSLIKVYQSENNLRYTMLETIRKYAEGKLADSEEKNNLHKSHFDFFYKLVEDSEDRLTGKEQKEWIKRIASENENIRDCLRWSLENGSESSLKMSVALGKFWELRSHFSEGLEFLLKSLEISRSVDLISKAKAIYWAGFFLINQGNYAESKKYLNQCLEIFRESEFKNGEAATLISLGMLCVFEADYENLQLFSDKALEISVGIGNRSFTARTLQNIGLGLMQMGKHDEAREKFIESLNIYRELDDWVQIGKIIGNIGALEYLLCNYEKARTALEESLQIRSELGDRQGIAIALNNLGSIAYMNKDFDTAEKFIEKSIEIVRELGDRRVYVTPICTLGSIANDKEDFPKASEMFREAVTISNEIGDKYTIAKGLEGFAGILAQMKMYREACLIAGKYILLLETSRKNLIEGEISKMEEMKSLLRSNLNEDDFKKYLSEGEKMTVEEALECIDLNLKF